MIKYICLNCKEYFALSDIVKKVHRYQCINCDRMNRPTLPGSLMTRTEYEEKYGPKKLKRNTRKQNVFIPPKMRICTDCSRAFNLDMFPDNDYHCSFCKGKSNETGNNSS